MIDFKKIDDEVSAGIVNTTVEDIMGWNLSDKIFGCEKLPNCNYKCGRLDIKDVREFIKRLKEGIKVIYCSDCGFLNEQIEVIDRLAGDKLV